MLLSKKVSVRALWQIDSSQLAKGAREAHKYNYNTSRLQ